MNIIQKHEEVIMDMEVNSIEKHGEAALNGALSSLLSGSEEPMSVHFQLFMAVKSVTGRATYLHEIRDVLRGEYDPTDRHSHAENFDRKLFQDLCVTFTSLASSESLQDKALQPIKKDMANMLHFHLAEIYMELHKKVMELLTSEEVSSINREAKEKGVNLEKHVRGCLRQMIE